MILVKSPIKLFLKYYYNCLLENLVILRFLNFQVTEKRIPIWGRQLLIKEYVENVAKISFQDLCVSCHSAADYLELASNIKILIVTNVPRMKLENRNEARRFITLIDTLYENRVKLLLSCSAPITELLSGEIQNQTQLDDSQRLLLDDLKLTAKHVRI